jgi:hypothetical protein
VIDVSSCEILHAKREIPPCICFKNCGFNEKYELRLPCVSGTAIKLVQCLMIKLVQYLT